MTTTIDPTRELVVTREFGAPRDLVLKMWSDPAMITYWWGPFGFTTTTHEMDFRPGGVWRFTMHGPDGTDYPNFIRYVKTGPDQIEYDHGCDSKSVDFHVVVTLEEKVGGKTSMEFRMVFPSVEERTRIVETYGADKGLFQTVTRLDTLLADKQAEDEPFKMALSLPSPTEIRTVRSLRAPKELVFEAFTNPDYIRRWQGPRDIVCTECTFDARVGGRWTMTHERAGEKYRFSGEILEISRPDRLVGTFQYEDYDPLTNTTTFEEKDGITRVTTISSFTTTENRDGMLYSGMEHGMVEGYERLQEIFDTEGANN